MRIDKWLVFARFFKTRTKVLKAIEKKLIFLNGLVIKKQSQLLKLEDDAKKEGLESLITEASLISYKLFLKNNWEIVRKEKIIIKNKYFERYKMKKILN